MNQFYPFMNQMNWESPYKKHPYSHGPYDYSYHHNDQGYYGHYYGYQPNPYFGNHPIPYHGDLPYANYPWRQGPIKGQATWTEGGAVTKCGMSWSTNSAMTAAVSDQSPYRCGQTLKIKNPANQREVIVTVVDTVQNFPTNRINLHRRAFETIGDLNAGVIDIEITPSPEVEEEKWGKYLLEVTQSAYPNFNVLDYKSIGKTSLSANQTKEVYDYTLQSPQERIKVRGTVVYNPANNRIVSFDVKELKN
ncbi:DUF3889 domain-containing protein [Bacillaceae bacterium S4-13-58]